MSHIFGNRSYSRFERKQQMPIDNILLESARSKGGDVQIAPSPDPSRYRISEFIECNGHLAIDITYPDCKNYEGRKILVFENTRLVDLMNQREIDPHFLEDNRFISPIARFKPTEEGWAMAVDLINRMKPAQIRKLRK